MRDIYTGNPLRDIGYFRWYDPLAWMEHMKGFTWDAIVKKENVHFRTAIEALATEKELSTLQDDFHSSAEKHLCYDVFHADSIDITPHGTYSYLWKWRGEKTRFRAAAVSCEGEFVWAVEEDSKGGEQYTVACYRKGAETPVWKYSKGVGPSLCVKEGLCYVVEATSALRYGVLVALNANTGVVQKKLFTEPSLRNSLRLEMGEHKCVFLVSSNSGREALYHVEGLTIQRIGSGGVAFLPVGYASETSDIPCFFARIRSFDGPWTAFGKELQILSIPLALRKYRMSVSLKQRILYTYAGGVGRIYKLRAGLSPKLLHEGSTSWSFDPWAQWSGRETISAIATSPGACPAVYEVGSTGLKRKEAAEVYAKGVSLHTSTSKDGTEVPFFFVEGSGTKGLLVSFYGAYNIPTSLSTMLWKPWLDRGWSVALGMIRGGGDFGDAWAEAARREKKIRSIEDAEAVIFAAQKLSGIPPSRTCIHGVSAGGYTLGALVSRHPTGDLFGAAYALVPYVDVLRTTTNPNLPLTILEYDEFGNPSQKLADLAAILHLSPVDSLPENGAPAIFVVARTSLYDIEVLPYESVKWMYRLRGWPSKLHGEEKYLSITAGAGHFVRGSQKNLQSAEDFVLLNSWLSSRLA